MSKKTGEIIIQFGAPPVTLRTKLTSIEDFPPFDSRSFFIEQHIEQKSREVIDCGARDFYIKTEAIVRQALGRHGYIADDTSAVVAEWVKEPKRGVATLLADGVPVLELTDMEITPDTKNGETIYRASQTYRFL